MVQFNFDFILIYLIKHTFYTFKNKKINQMKKTLSSQSLFSLRRNTTAGLLSQQKDQVGNIKKIRIPSPIVKNINLITSNQHIQTVNLQKSKKNDIQQIYEYKIKQRAKKSKLIQNYNEIRQNNKPTSPLLLPNNKEIDSLKMQNQKMSKELAQLSKQNLKLKQLLSTVNDSKIKHKNDKTKNQTKDYKKQMLNKLNDRHRLKTQATNINCGNFDQLQHKDKCINNKNSKSRRKSSSKNSITMNLNMSFVKLKSPSCGKSIELIQNQKYFSKLIASKSRKSLQQKDKSLKSPKFNHSQINIKSLFDQYSMKQTINGQDLQKFYSLLKKVLIEFNQMIVYSKRTYTQILQKTNYLQYCNSKHMQESTKIQKDSNKMYKTLKKIQQLYKIYSPQQISSKSQYSYFNKQQQSDQTKKILIKSKLNTEEYQQRQTPSSSSKVSVTQIHNNPQREKSYQKYRLKKLNQNLDLLANFQNKKLKTQVLQPLTTEPKVYFSKPVSTNISRKISFNNSLNNSLKNSKYCQ